MKRIILTLTLASLFVVGARAQTATWTANLSSYQPSGARTAVATASLDLAGAVDAIAVSNGGLGYTSAPTVTVTAASGDTGSGATATATLVNGIVTGITVTNHGAGYTVPPTVTVSGGFATGKGPVSFTVTIVYPTGATPTGLSFKVDLPTGWAFERHVLPTGATAAAFPQTGEQVLEWAFTSYPMTQLRWTFYVSYAAGVTGDQVFSVDGTQSAYFPGRVLLSATPITLTAAPTPPAITTQPFSQTVTAGANVTLTSGAVGSPAPTLQWKKDGVNVTNGGRFAGATTATLQITGALMADAGSYTLVASNASGTDAVSNAAVLTVNKASQTITFITLPPKTYGDAAFTLTGSASSLLTVSYTSSNLGVATVSGSTVTIIGAGATTITASQSGSADYTAATPVAQALTVNPAAATVALSGLAAIYNGSAKSATATTTPAGLPVVLTYAGNATAPTNAGSYAVVGTINHANYAGTASGPLVIAKADQNITFVTLPSKPLDSGNFTLAANASSGQPVAYATSSPSSGTVATVSGSTVTLVNTGTITITASQAGNANYNAATPAIQVLTVLNQSQTITFDQTQLPGKTLGNESFPISATSNRTGLKVNFTSANPAVATVSPSTLAAGVSTATVSLVGAGTVKITASQAGDANTAAANLVDCFLTVGKGTATVMLGSLAQTYDGTPKAATATTDPVGLTVGFTYGVSTTAPTAAGSYAVVGTVNDSNYNGTASGTLVVAKAPQTITFAALPAKALGSGTFTLAASASSGLPVSYASSTPSVATVSGNVVTLVGPGTTTITAKQAGDTNFLAATDAPQTLTVNSAPVFTLQPAVAIFYLVGAPVNLTVAASGLPAPTFQWRKGGATIPGATNATFTIAGVQLADRGSYDVVATNVVASATSSPVPLVIYQPPAFTTQPSNQTAVAGQGASFTVAVTGDPAPTLQWRRNGLNLKGATDATLTLSNVSFDAGGAFTAMATNPGGSVTSTPATLTVNPVAPVITSPLTANGVVGRKFMYQVTATATQAIYSATGLPAGLALNETTGVILGNPTTATGGTPASVVLTVSNISGFDTKTLVLTILPPPPVISSAAAAVGRVNATFNFAVTASNSPSSYSATGLPPGLSIGAGNGVISGTPTQAGAFLASITAANATGSVTNPLAILIDPALNAPVFTGGTNLSAVQGSLFNFTPMFANGVTSFSATGLPAGLSINASSGLISGTPTATGVFTINVTATNAGGAVTVPFTLTVNPAPTAPVVTSASRAAGIAGTSFSFTLTASPSTGATFSATGLPALGLSLAGGTGIISGFPTGPGTLSLQVNAANGVGSGPTSVLVISVQPSATAPVLTSAPIVRGTAGTLLTYNLAGTNVNGATTFAVSGGTLPPGLSLDPASGAVSGVPTQAGRSDVWFAAANASGAGLALGVTFQIEPAPTMPVVNSNGSAVGQVGQPFQYLITATNGPILSCGATGLTPGLLLNPATGVISGIPTTATTATVSVMLTATNAGGTSNPKTLSLSIAAAPATPSVTSTLSISGQVGVAFSYQITASESPTSFVATDLPAGLSNAPATGLISGTPTQSGVFNVKIGAANAAGLGEPSTLVISVAPAPQAPVITSAASVSGKVGAVAPFSYTITASPGPITGYSLTGTLPLGLSVNTSTGIISGRPAQSGVFMVQLTATSSAGTSSPQTLAINIAPADSVPVITSPTVAQGTVGANFSYQITASNPPLLTLDAVNLPAGLAVNPSTGLIQGVPTAVGTVTATLVGTNAAGSGPDRDLVIAIQPAATAPVITNSAPVIAMGQVGAAFSFQITAANNPTSYEVMGAPGWMTINSTSGALAGTPAEPGSYSMQLLAINAAGTSSPVTLRVNVNAAAGTPVVNSSQTARGTVGMPFLYLMMATNGPSSYRVGGLPPGLALNSATGLINGTPTLSGTFYVTLSGRNANGFGNPVILVLTVSTSLQFVAPPR